MRDRALVAGAAPPSRPISRPKPRASTKACKRNLSRMGVPFRENPRIVRGLDYYSHTAFEFVTTALGAQGTVMAGGRYDGLVAQMGGPPTPAVGWAAGVERLAMLLARRARRARARSPSSRSARPPNPPRPPFCNPCAAPASAPKWPIAAT